MKRRVWKKNSTYLRATSFAERLPVKDGEVKYPEADTPTDLACETCGHDVRVLANGGTFKRAVVCPKCSRTGALVISAIAPDGLPCVVVMMGVKEGTRAGAEIFPLSDLDTVLREHASAN